MLLKSLGSDGNSGGKPGFIDALEEMIDSLRKEIMNKFVDKEDFNGLKKRVDDLEYEQKETDRVLNNYGNSLSQCRDITDSNNLDIKDLKRLLQDLKKRIKALKKGQKISEKNLEVEPS